MLHDITITVDDDVYQTLKPMVDQQTIGSFLHEFVQTRTIAHPIPSITTFRGSLQNINTSDIREDDERFL